VDIRSQVSKGFGTERPDGFIAYLGASRLEPLEHHVELVVFRVLNVRDQLVRGLQVLHQNR
jgi:hypothetical protein